MFGVNVSEIVLLLVLIGVGWGVVYSAVRLANRDQNR